MKYARFISWHSKSAHNSTNEPWIINACFQIDYFPPPIFLEETKMQITNDLAFLKGSCIYTLKAMAYLLACLEIHQYVIALPPRSPSTWNCFEEIWFLFPSIKTAAVFYRGRKNKHQAKQRVSSNFMLYTAMWLEGFVWCKYGPLPMSARVCMQPKIPSGLFENGPYVPTNTDWFESSGRLLFSFSIQVKH